MVNPSDLGAYDIVVLFVWYLRNSLVNDADVCYLRIHRGHGFIGQSQTPLVTNLSPVCTSSAKALHTPSMLPQWI